MDHWTSSEDTKKKIKTQSIDWEQMFENTYLIKELNRSAWEAQSFKCPTLGFGPDHDNGL